MVKKIRVFWNGQYIGVTTEVKIIGEPRKEETLYLKGELSPNLVFIKK